MSVRAPLRIVHLVGSPAAAWLLSIVREQRRRGHEVCVIVGGAAAGALPAAFAAEGVPYYRATFELPHRIFLVRWLMQLVRLTSLLRQIRADVVQLHLGQANIVGRLAAWLADAPLRFTMIPGTLYLESPGLGEIDVDTQWIDTKTIASCERTRTLYVEGGVDRERVALVYYGLDTAGFDPDRADGARVRRELGLATSAPVIGVVARFYGVSTSPLSPPYLRGRDIKGRDVLIRAMPHVLARVPDAKLVVAGGPWGPRGAVLMHDLTALADALGIGASVVFTGNRADVPDVLMACDVAVQCSLCENLGGTIEALTMGRPLVATEVGGMVDTTIHEHTGLLVPPDNVPALADALIRLLTDRALGRRLGAAGRAFMLQKFTASRTGADLDELYAQCGRDLRYPDALPRVSGYRATRTAWRAIILPLRVLPLFVTLLIGAKPLSGGWAEHAAWLLRPFIPSPVRDFLQSRAVRGVRAPGPGRSRPAGQP